MLWNVPEPIEKMFMYATMSHDDITFNGPQHSPCISDASHCTMELDGTDIVLMSPN